MSLLGEILQASSLPTPSATTREPIAINRNSAGFSQFRFQPTPLAIPQYVGVCPFVSAIEQDDLFALPIWTVDVRCVNTPGLQTTRRARPLTEEIEEYLPRSGFHRALGARIVPSVVMVFPNRDNGHRAAESLVIQHSTIDGRSSNASAQPNRCRHRRCRQDERRGRASRLESPSKPAISGSPAGRIPWRSSSAPQRPHDVASPTREHRKSRNPATSRPG